MHFSDARVCMDGCVVVEGTIDYPPISEEKFALPKHSELQLFVGTSGGWVTVSNCRRDRKCGFFVSKDPPATSLHSREEPYPKLTMPRAVASTLYHALRFGCSEPLFLSVTDNEGYLGSSGTSGATGSTIVLQGVTDWQLEVCERDGNVHVRMSALLVSTSTPRWWHKRGPAPQFWNATSANSPSVSVAFVVDAATRAVAFERFHSSLNSAGSFEYEEACLTTAETVKLESAHLGRLGELFAVYTNPPNPGAGWASISSYDRWIRTLCSIRISTHFRVYESRFGFLAGEYTGFSLPVPNVELYGISLEAVVKASLTGSRTKIELSGEGVGKLSDSIQERGEAESSQKFDRTIHQAFLTFCLGASGLNLGYRVTSPILKYQKPTPGWLEAELNISWETLMVRYPQLAMRRLDFVSSD